MSEIHSPGDFAERPATLAGYPSFEISGLETVKSERTLLFKYKRIGKKV